MTGNFTSKRIVTLFLFCLLIAVINAGLSQAQSVENEYGSEFLAKLATRLLDDYSSGSLDWLDPVIFEQLMMSILDEYESALLAETAPEVSIQVESQSRGAEVLMIQKSDAVCRIIGEDVESGRPITSCFWGRRVDNSKYDDTTDITNVRVVAMEELYFGGTYTNGVYNRDGEFIGKYRKFFKYNENADIFWKVEVGLNGSTLEFCSMRDMEYSDTSRTKEYCQSLYIDIQ